MDLGTKIREIGNINLLERVEKIKNKKIEDEYRKHARQGRYERIYSLHKETGYKIPEDIQTLIDYHSN